VERVDDFGRSMSVELRAGADAQQLLRHLVDAGAQIERFEMVRPSLRRIFLDAVGAAGSAPEVSGHG
jgi:hypothetical protein